MTRSIYFRIRFSYLLRASTSHITLGAVREDVAPNNVQKINRCRSQTKVNSISWGAEQLLALQSELAFSTK